MAHPMTNPDNWLVGIFSMPHLDISLMFLNHRDTEGTERKWLSPNGRYCRLFAFWRNLPPKTINPSVNSVSPWWKYKLQPVRFLNHRGTEGTERENISVGALGQVFSAAGWAAQLDRPAVFQGAAWSGWLLFGGISRQKQFNSSVNSVPPWWKIPITVFCSGPRKSCPRRLGLFLFFGATDASFRPGSGKNRCCRESIVTWKRPFQRHADVTISTAPDGFEPGCGPSHTSMTTDGVHHDVTRGKKKREKEVKLENPHQRCNSSYWGCRAKTPQPPRQGLGAATGCY